MNTDGPSLLQTIYIFGRLSFSYIGISKAVAIIRFHQPLIFHLPYNAMSTMVILISGWFCSWPLLMIKDGSLSNGRFL